MNSPIEYSKVLLYISKIIFPVNGHIFPVYMFVLYKLVVQLIHLQIKAVPLKHFQHVQSSEDVPINSLNKCLVSRVVYKIIHVLYGKQKKICIKLSPKLQTTNLTTKQRFVLIGSADIDDDTIIVTHDFQFNIGLEPVDDYHISLHNFNFYCTYPKLASGVNVAFINNHFDVNQYLLESLLTSFFKTPTLLYLNDVFEVSVEKLLPELLYTNPDLQHKRYFFKCLQICNGSEKISKGFCVKGETRLTQTHNIQSFIPKSLFSNFIQLNNSNLVENVLQNCPYGLEKYAKSIEQCLVPFLKRENLSTTSSLKPAFLLKGKPGSGKLLLVQTLAVQFGLHFIKIDCSDLISSTAAHTEKKIQTIFVKVKLCSPCILLLNKFEDLCKDEDGNQDLRLASFFQTSVDILLSNNNFPIILICSCNTDLLHSTIERVFLQVLQVDYPTIDERGQLLQWLMLAKNQNIENSKIIWDHLAKKTHSFVFADLEHLVSQVLSSNNEISHIKQFMNIIDEMQDAFANSIGTPKIPRVHWDDVGGLAEIKQEIIKTINYPIQFQNLIDNIYLKRSGLLLYGPPGTGKTLIAKAVATECCLNFMSVKGPELLNMYVGQSELNVRQVFARARQAAPCVIFFDELDSLAPKRGLSGDSSGVMDRVISQLLAEMDGLNEASTVFVIGATNRPDLIDPALLRPGRFDKLLYVGISSENETKIEILKALSRKMNISDDTFIKVVNILPKHVTGADLQALCANAWLISARRVILEKDAGNNFKQIELTVDDFEASISLLKPSVTAESMRYYSKINRSLQNII